MTVDFLLCDSPSPSLSSSLTNLNYYCSHDVYKGGKIEDKIELMNTLDAVGAEELRYLLIESHLLFTTKSASIKVLKELQFFTRESVSLCSSNNSFNNFISPNVCTRSS